MLTFLFNLLMWIIRVFGWALVIYCAMTWIMPDNRFTTMLGRYIEPILRPIRGWIAKLLPSVSSLHVDLSPIVLWLLLNVLRWLLTLLWRLLF